MWLIAPHFGWVSTAKLLLHEGSLADNTDLQEVSFHNGQLADLYCFLSLILDPELLCLVIENLLRYTTGLLTGAR